MISACKNSPAVFLCLILLTAWSAGAGAHVPLPPKTGEAGRVAANVEGPEFSLLDQEGRPFHSRKLQGKVVLVTFIFTTCPDVCPLFTARFAQIQRALAQQNRQGDVFLVSITTDPEVDTPLVLKGYAERYGADTKNWAFLTGSEKELQEIWRAFDVTVVKRRKGLVQHTGLTTLIDREGTRRYNYYGDRWREKQVLEDIATLLKK